MPLARPFTVVAALAALVVVVLASAACRQTEPPRAPVNDRFVEAHRTLAEWAKRPHYTNCVGWSVEKSPRLAFMRARVAHPEAITLFHFHAVCDPNHPDAAGALQEDRTLLARGGDARLYDVWNAEDLVAFAAAERLPLKDAAGLRTFFGADHDPLLTVEPDGSDARRWRLVRAFSGRGLPPTVRIVVLDEASVPQRIEAAR